MIMKPRVLVSDKLSLSAIKIFEERGVDIDFEPDLGKDKKSLAERIGDYDGLAIRSTTKITPNILKYANKLKVIGRAGIGVDNIDKIAASKKGIIIMNTPFGNMITTAEHAIAMMFAVARQIPEANTSTQAGKWEKSKFMGVELTSKTVGVIGAGNIGGVFCERARSLKMKVVAYDPYLSEEKAKVFSDTKSLEDYQTGSGDISVSEAINRFNAHLGSNFSDLSDDDLRIQLTERWSGYVI